MTIKEFRASTDVSESIITIYLLKQIKKWSEEAYSELKNTKEFEKFLIPSEIFGLLCLFGKEKDMTYLVYFSTEITGQFLLNFYAISQVKENI